jgi:hypothetical protein
VRIALNGGLQTQVAPPSTQVQRMAHDESFSKLCPMSRTHDVAIANENVQAAFGIRTKEIMTLHAEGSKSCLNRGVNL